MKTQHKIQLLSLAILGFILNASAQDALRLSLTGQDAAAVRKRTIENQPYTVRWGDFKLLSSASLATEFNDNVNLSHVDPQEDVIFRPVANFDAFWPITELNALSFSIGAGYEAFINYDEYSRAVVTPGSQLGWDVFIRDFQLSFHDQFSFEEDPTVWGAVSDTAQAGGFYNTAGFLGTWDLNDVVLSIGYDHFNFISSSSRYEYLNRASDFGLLRGAFRVHPSAVVGAEASAGPTTYDQPILSDNTTYSLGAFAEWQATEHIKLTPRGGYYLYSYADEGLIGRGVDQTGYYFSLRFNHDLRWSIGYNVDVGREAYLGNFSALTEQWFAGGFVNSHIIKSVSMSIGLRYEAATQPVGYSTGDYDRLYWSFRLSCPIKPKLTAGVEYKFWLRNSQQSSYYDYTQNRLIVQLAYTF